MKDRKPSEWGCKFFFTINDNALTALLMKTGEILSEKGIEGFKLALEMGKKGNLHTHIYIVFNRSQRKETLLNRYKKWGVQIDRVTPGTEKTVIEYIGSEEKTKEKDSLLFKEYTTIWGDVVTSQGARNDIGDTEKALWQIKDAIDSGANTRQIWNDFFPYMVRWGKGVYSYIEMIDKERKNKIDVDNEKDVKQIIAIRKQVALDKEFFEAQTAYTELKAAEDIWNKINVN